MNSQLNRKRILIVGVVSNVEHKLAGDVQKIQFALSSFNEIHFFIVESNSSDETIAVLNQLRFSITNFKFITLGKLGIKDRIERIRYCRNQYVNYIRNIPSTQFPDYIIVADLDGMNSALSKKGFESCFNKDDWDVVVANQKHGYYDIYALRHDPWQVSDCFAELENLKKPINLKVGLDNGFFYRMKLRLEYDKARSRAIYSKMVTLNPKSEWILVISGFGGFGIYRSDLFLRYDYSKIKKDLDFIESEHVDFHEKISKDGGRIYINPALINSNWNTHNINKYFIVRNFRQFLNSKEFIKKLVTFFSNV